MQVENFTSFAQDFVDAFREARTRRSNEAAGSPPGNLGSDAAKRTGEKPTGLMKSFRQKVLPSKRSVLLVAGTLVALYATYKLLKAWGHYEVERLAVKNGTEEALAHQARLAAKQQNRSQN